MKQKSTSLTPEKKKLANKIHKWAYIDPNKHPKKFEKLFNEIWKSQLREKR